MLTQDDVINYLLKQGVKPKKLILDLALYGNTFTLYNPRNTNIGSSTEGAGRHSEFPKGSTGYTPFFEVNLINTANFRDC